jgi:hypothetical protein
MKFAEVRDMAKGMGIKAGKASKAELIRSIQEAESNIPCFGTDRVGYCGEDIRSEHLHHAGWEQEDYRSLGFSNSISRCRYVRGYCAGRDINCIRDPGIVASLLRRISEGRREGAALACLLSTPD